MMKKIYHIYLKKFQLVDSEIGCGCEDYHFVELPWEHVCDVSGLEELRAFFFPDNLWYHPISRLSLKYLFADSFIAHPKHTCYVVLDANGCIVDAARLLDGVVYPNCHHLNKALGILRLEDKSGGKSICARPSGKPKDSRALRKECESLKGDYPYANVSLKCGDKVKDKEIRFREDDKDRSWKRFRKHQNKRGGKIRKTVQKFDLESLREELIKNKS